MRRRQGEFQNKNPPRRLGAERSSARRWARTVKYGVKSTPAPMRLAVLNYRVHTIFLLSPAKSGGKRAELIFNPRARFDLACRMQRGEAVPICEIFSFLSGLYFRGKMAYARTYARPRRGMEGIYIITTNRGLIGAETALTLPELAAFARVEIDHQDARYRGPLERDARSLAKKLGLSGRAVLLGSIGTKKYVEALLTGFAERLMFPVDFVGRGDMSRGGLLLRRAADGPELVYASVAGSVRRGKRPPRLEPRSWAGTKYAFGQEAAKESA